MSTAYEKKGEKGKNYGGNVNGDKKRVDRKRNCDRRERGRDNGREDKERKREVEDSIRKWEFRKNVAKNGTVARGERIRN